jgi:hypothetical protein
MCVSYAELPALSMRSFFLLWQQLLEVLKQSLHPPSNSPSAAGVVIEVNLQAGQTVASACWMPCKSCCCCLRGPDCMHGVCWRGRIVGAAQLSMRANQQAKPSCQLRTQFHAPFIISVASEACRTLSIHSFI